MAGHYRESRRLVKQLATAREELKEQSSSSQSLKERLKAQGIMTGSNTPWPQDPANGVFDDYLFLNMYACTSANS